MILLNCMTRAVSVGFHAFTAGPARTRDRQQWRPWLGWLVLALWFGLPAKVSAADQTSFASAEAAVEALMAAMDKNDEAALVSIFGDQHRYLVVTGDAANDTARRAEVAALLKSFHSLEERGDERILLMGPRAWPVPIPLVRANGGWRFATERGADEILNRRVGANERSAIVVLRAFVEAQRQYAARDRNGDGVLEYAQKLASQPGKADGLYWPADESKGEETSPFGPLIAESSAYLAGHRRGDPYRGYRFRILTRQGKSAPGGAYGYLINGRLLGGFAMVAYPSKYGDSGVMSFIVSHNGKIYEKDLGRSTTATAARLNAFDPGAGWRPVEP